MTPPRPRRRVRRLLLGVVGSLVLLVALTYVGTALLKVPPPHRLAQILAAPPSEQGQYFPARTVQAPDVARPFPEDVRPLPATVPWKGAEEPLSEVLEETHTNAFLVVQDGTLVHEWYAEGVEAGDRMSSWSVAKSVVSLLVGQSIEAGRFAEGDLVVDLVPELGRAGNGFDDVTVGELLDMSSGVDVAENYRAYWPFTGTARLFLSTDLTGYLADHRDVAFAPGSRGEYRSVDTQLLGMVLRATEGKPLAELLTERLWGPVGAESDATWNLDETGGTEKAFCCLNATARDFAKLGQLLVDGGQVDGEQVVPTAWLERIATPAEHQVSTWDYSAQWWQPEGADGDLTALGIHGQYIYVNPRTGTVIVKLSDHGTEQDEQETFTAMQSIAAALAD